MPTVQNIIQLSRTIAVSTSEYESSFSTLKGSNDHASLQEGKPHTHLILNDSWHANYNLMDSYCTVSGTPDQKTVVDCSSTDIDILCYRVLAVMLQLNK